MKILDLNYSLDPSNKAHPSAESRPVVEVREILPNEPAPASAGTSNSTGEGK